MSDASTPRRTRLQLVLLVLLSVLPFSTQLGNRFAFDDSLARSTGNRQQFDPLVYDLHPPWEFFRHQYWHGEGGRSRLYRPLTILSYSYTWQLVGRHIVPEGWPERRRGPISWDEVKVGEWWEALPHRLLNLLLNAAAACLVFFLVGGLGLSSWAAFVCAGMFGVHALHTEVVAGIVGRAELLSFCLGALGVLAYRRARARGSMRDGVLAGLCLFGALCSKESAVAWLPFLPCYLWARAWAQGAAAQLRAQLRPLLLVTGLPLLAFVGLRALAVDGMPEDVFYAANPLYHEPALVRLATAIKLWGLGLLKCIWPFELSCIYGLEALTLTRSLFDLGFLAALLVLAAWLAWGLWRPARRPLVFSSVALFFGFSVLTSNVPFAIGTMFGERLYFIPSLGVCLLAAWGLDALRGVARRGLLAVLVVWAGWNIWVDLWRCPVWADNPTLMLNDVQVQPDSVSLNNKAAEMLWFMRDYQPERKAEHEAGAWRHLHRAQELDPGFIKSWITEADFLLKQAWELEFAGKLDAAREKRRAALRCYESAHAQTARLAISGQEPFVKVSLGSLLMKLGDPRRGFELTLQGYRMRPDRIAMQMARVEAGFLALERGLPRVTPELLDSWIQAGLAGREFQESFVLARVRLWYEYGEKNAEVAKAIVQALQPIVQGVDRSPDKQAKSAEQYRRARRQLAMTLKAMQRSDAARHHLQVLAELPNLEPAERREVEQALAELRR